ncbi:hypothetical protein ACFOEZ_00895 [Tianweitania populi]|uniref:Uncharacterized protein n=1 Tax=Tianweitania populi TaxID=1607949 RepID=A0A8J3GM91_9HYPH|nr:hypothetical protein [Tianweitania populi]GHD21673.1 hypothetical protein GCM10016234_35220 [Tianweitania populi]
MRFVFPHSHAFRKGRVTVDDDGKPGPECLVEFGDGITVIAEWSGEDDVLRLSIPEYCTARGTVVNGRTWRVAKGKDRLWRSELLSMNVADQSANVSSLAPDER